MSVLCGVVRRCGVFGGVHLHTQSMEVCKYINCIYITKTFVSTTLKSKFLHLMPHIWVVIAYRSYHVSHL